MYAREKNSKNYITRMKIIVLDIFNNDHATQNDNTSIGTHISNKISAILVKPKCFAYQ